MSLSRYLTTVVVAVPLFLVFGFQQPFYIWLLMATVAIGAGYLVEGFIARWQPPPHTSPAAATRVDRKWELQRLLNGAVAEEGRGDSPGAIALFEQALRIADCREDAAQVRKQIANVREWSRSAEFHAHQWPRAAWEVQEDNSTELLTGALEGLEAEVE